jgi:hypothetical protein
LDECWNCGCGVNWSPPKEREPVAADGTESNGSTTSKAAPFSDSETGLLRFLGFAAAAIGVIGGLITLANIPDAPVLNMLYLAIGGAEIVSGVTTGVFLYVVAGIGDAVLDLWTAQQNGKEAAPIKDAI